MKTWLGVAALFICVVGSTSCENIPLGAYSLASDPLPARAQLVAQAQYAELQKSGRFYSISNQSIGEQQQAAAHEEWESDRVIAQFRKAHPQAGALLPPVPREPGVRFNPDDTYSHAVPLNDGRSIEVLTMGRRWSKSTLRRTIEAFPTRANQLGTYRMFYDSLGEGTRLALALPDPEALQADEALYPAARILALNDQLASRLAQSPSAVDATPATTSLKAPACAAEEGAGNGSDRSGNDDSNPACGSQPGGLYAHYSWPSKPFLTCVKDQANRGTCVAFSTASALESLVAKTQGRFVNVSEQYFYELGKLNIIREDFSEGLVDWEVLSSAVSGKWKFPFETAWEYNPSRQRQTNASAHLYTKSCDGYTGSCSDSAHQMQVYCNDQGTARYCGFLAEPQPPQGFVLSGTSELWNLLDHGGSIARIVATLKLGMPVILAFNVTPSWDAVGADGFVSYKSGEGNRGGHAVHIVGSIDNATLARTLPGAPAGSGGGYLIIKNSWTNCWSDGGFVYVPYDYVSSYATGADAITI